jgi:hypothetical protein
MRAALYRAAEPRVDEDPPKAVQREVHLPPQGARGGKEKHQEPDDKLTENLRGGGTAAGGI